MTTSHNDRDLSSDNSQRFESRLAAEVSRWGERYSLSPRERDLLQRAARGEPRALIAEQMQCAPRTFKKHCQNLLKKTGDDWLLEAVNRLLRDLANS
jgi:DNA-binding CsgD family transcriptional regulator